MMDALLNWISNHEGVVTSVATVAIAMFAGITAWLTRSLVAENKRLRNVGVEPRVVAYLIGDTQNVHLINLVLANVGRGPARNIKFILDLEDKYFGHNRVASPNKDDRAPIGFLLQDDKWIMLFGSGPGLLNEAQIPPFEIKIQWENFDGKRYEGKYTLDVSQFRGVFLPVSSSENEIVKSLTKISKRLDSFATAGSSGRLKVETMTASEARQRRLEHQKAVENDDQDQSEN